MPVDEVILADRIAALQGAITSFTANLQKAKSLHATFEKIGLDSDGNIKTDADTGITMTQQRRDDVYDNCLSEVNTLLGIS